MRNAIACVAVPPSSLVEHSLEPRDYADAFAITLPSDVNVDIDSIARACVDMPYWVRALMRVRNAVVRRFGLITALPALEETADGPIQPGSRVGIFPLLERTNHELLFGLDDKHLDFRFSLLRRPVSGAEELVATTLVRYKNFWGRLYFMFVKPVHKRVIPAMLRSARHKLG
ncbi:MAG TPA: DUF2867 domain-containing protein [Polyangiaceae bacterium]|nr:DUF2867 domain-containing protein [Polyangiaceae bacterium]